MQDLHIDIVIGQDQEKNKLCITGGICYYLDSAGFSVSALNKDLCILTGKCFEIGNKTYSQTIITME